MKYIVKNPVASQREIDGFLKAFEFEATSEFIEYCLSDNGGKLGSWEYLVPRELGDSFSELGFGAGKVIVQVSGLFGVQNILGEYSVAKQTLFLRASYDLPDECVAIGKDHFGNPYCMKSKELSVYYWLREEGLLYIIAKSFADFHGQMKEQRFSET